MPCFTFPPSSTTSSSLTCDQAAVGFGESALESATFLKTKTSELEAAVSGASVDLDGLMKVMVFEFPCR